MNTQNFVSLQLPKWNAQNPAIALDRWVWHSHSRTHFHSSGQRHWHTVCVYHGDTHKHSFYRSTKLHKAPNASSLWGWTKDREAGLWAGPVCRGGGTEDGCKQHRPAYTLQARLLRHMAWWRQGLGIPVRRGEGCRGSEAQATWNLDRCSRQAYKLLTVLDRMSSKLLNMHQQTRA